MPQLSLTPKGHLLVQFEHGHSVVFPPTLPALRVLVRMLEIRQFGHRKVAEPGALTQAQIDDALRLSAIAKVIPKGKVKISLKDLGL